MPKIGPRNLYENVHLLFANIVEKYPKVGKMDLFRPCDKNPQGLHSLHPK